MQGFQVSRGSNGAAGMTSKNGNVGAGSTVIELVAPSNQVKITNYDAINPLYINFGGAATTGSYKIMPGQTFEYNGSAISSLQLSAGTGSINYGCLAI